LVDWYAFYTKSRHEKRVHRDLLAEGCESFLPLHRVTRQWADRRKEVELPLFPGYIFVRCADADDMWHVVYKDGVVKVLGATPTQPTPIPAEEIESIRRAQEKGFVLEPHTYLRRGRKVRIARGPLVGIEGIILEEPRKARLVLSIHAIGRSASLEIDSTYVEPVRTD
jgi:transcription antitermination factor NusG